MRPTPHTQLLKHARQLLRLTNGRSGRRKGGGFPASLDARGLVLWAAALITCIVCVWEHVHSTELASEIEGLRERKEDLLAEIGFLSMECTELMSRERIEERAGEMLGMRYPAHDEMIWLAPDGTRRRSKQEYVEAGEIDPSDG